MQQLTFAATVAITILCKQQQKYCVVNRFDARYKIIQKSLQTHCEEEDKQIIINDHYDGGAFALTDIEMVSMRHMGLRVLEICITRSYFISLFT
jgi:hypothetical protein